MTRRGFWVRMLIALAIDAFDATLGRALPLVPWEEGFVVLLLAPLWGWASLAYLWELADLTEQIDGFVPTATMIGLLVGWRRGLLRPGRRA